MTTLDDYKAKLREIVEARDAAAPGEWNAEFDQNDKTVSSPNVNDWYVSFLSTDEGKFHVATADYASENDLNNFKFIALAANSIRDLARQQLALIEALIEARRWCDDKPAFIIDEALDGLVKDNKLTKDTK